MSMNVCKYLTTKSNTVCAKQSMLLSFPGSWKAQLPEITLKLTLELRPLIRVVETWTYEDMTAPYGARSRPDGLYRGWMDVTDHPELPPGVSADDVAVVPPGRVVGQGKTPYGFGWFLSMSGNVEIRATKSGCSGQCADLLLKYVRQLPWFAEGSEKLAAAEALCAIWKRWHLSDMRQGCEHLTPLLKNQIIHLRRYAYSDQYKSLCNATRDELFRLAIELVRSRSLPSSADKDVAVQSFLTQVDQLPHDLLWELADVDRVLLPDAAEGYEEAHVSWVKGVFRKLGMGELGPVWEDTTERTRLDPFRERSSRRCEVEFGKHPLGLMGGRCKQCGVQYGWSRRAEPLPDEVLFEQLPALLRTLGAHDELDWDALRKAQREAKEQAHQGHSGRQNLTSEHICSL